jgi:hypothetical protein
MRVSMDDFKPPWPHAREHGSDRVSGEGYYRNVSGFAIPGLAGGSSRRRALPWHRL